MEDVILKNGTVMTDAEFVKERGGDNLTDFVATKVDLVSLAHRLADELLADEFILLLQSSRSDKNRRDYTSFRLSRVMNFLPELDAEIREKLRLGYEQNANEAERVISEWQEEAAIEKQVPAYLDAVKNASSLEDAAREAETILRMDMFAEIPFLEKEETRQLEHLIEQQREHESN